MRKHYVIGVGGIGSWLAPSLCLLLEPDSIVLVDGDKLEKKNLNRQLFEESHIGDYKSVALGEKYGCEYLGNWYSFGSIEHDRNDWLFVCVDNNPARLSALQACDQYGCQAIFAANETTSSEAYYYRPKWKDTALDPRKYYPDLLTNHDGDPMRPEGCTGEAQKANRQLVSANFSGAALAQNLFVLWGLKSKAIDKDNIGQMPFRFRANLSKLESTRISDAQPIKDTND